MKIVADQNMPLVADLFGQFGEVYMMPGRDICADAIIDADMLLVRSVTSVNQDLLAGSSVKFVGSATAGIDHIDKHYLVNNNIQFAYAPGCNAQAVVEYVLSCLCSLSSEWQSKRVGIVGCGNVGSRLYRSLKALNMVTQVYDPFLAPNSLPDLCTFDDLFDCDIISLHTPLTTDGPYPTFHMFDNKALRRLKADSVLINSSRGGVVDNQALLDLLSVDRHFSVVLDVWEGEPSINKNLLDLTTIATPHIAGYSDLGKIKGTLMLFEAAQALLTPSQQIDISDLINGPPIQLALQGSGITDALVATYNVMADDQHFRDAIACSDLPLADVFDGFRKHYPQRKEYSCYGVDREHPFLNQLVALGFAAI